MEQHHIMRFIAHDLSSKLVLFHHPMFVLLYSLRPKTCDVCRPTSGETIAVWEHKCGECTLTICLGGQSSIILKKIIPISNFYLLCRYILQIEIWQRVRCLADFPKGLRWFGLEVWNLRTPWKTLEGYPEFLWNGEEETQGISNHGQPQVSDGGPNSNSPELSKVNLGITCFKNDQNYNSISV